MTPIHNNRLEKIYFFKGASCLVSAVSNRGEISRGRRPLTKKMVVFLFFLQGLTNLPQSSYLALCTNMPRTAPFHWEPTPWRSRRTGIMGTRGAISSRWWTLWNQLYFGVENHNFGKSVIWDPLNMFNPWGLGGKSQGVKGGPPLVGGRPHEAVEFWSWGATFSNTSICDLSTIFNHWLPSLGA